MATEFLPFLIQYGYLLLFLWILLDQAGLPLPSAPVLLAAGALCGSNQLNYWVVIGIAAIAAIPADYLWYHLGRTRGGKVLSMLCSISLEPDYCVRDTEAYFDRFGQFSLLIAKFIPGLQTIAPPMAGFINLSARRFLLLDLLGGLFWATTFVSIGAVFHLQLQSIAIRFSELGGQAGAILLSVFGLYIVAKIIQRQLFLRTLRMRRLAPDEVYQKMQSDSSVHIIDLRHRTDVSTTPFTLPSAHRIPMEHIEQHYESIPRDKDIVLYCS